MYINGHVRPQVPTTYLFSSLDKFDCYELPVPLILHQLGDTKVSAANIPDLRRKEGRMRGVSHPLEGHVQPAVPPEIAF